MIPKPNDTFLDSSRIDEIFPTPPFSGLALFGTVNSFSLRRIRTALDEIFPTPPFWGLAHLLWSASAYKMGSGGVLSCVVCLRQVVHRVVATTNLLIP